MGALIGTGAGAVYVTAWLFTARHLFRRWRIPEAQRRLCPQCGQRDDACRKCAKILPWWHVVWSEIALADLEPLPDGAVAFVALVHGLVWPVVLGMYAPYRFITSNAPLAPRELEEQVRERDKRITELEKDLNKALGE